MSFLSQIGVIILIVFIIVILIRANKTLEEVCEEGEHFVDEWDLRQQKKMTRIMEKEENREKKKLQKANKKDENKRNGEELTEENLEDEKEGLERERDEDRTYENIIPMNRYINPALTLIELDEKHMPVRKIVVSRLPFSIGRDKENDLVLDDLCVARKHCRIVERNGNYVMEDVGSKNKLFVDGMITDRIVLSDQLHIYIGNAEFFVERYVDRSDYTRIGQGIKERYYE